LLNISEAGRAGAPSEAMVDAAGPQRAAVEESGVRLQQRHNLMVQSPAAETSRSDPGKPEHQDAPVVAMHGVAG